MTLPHEQVYVRLGVSGIHGIGVFAIRPIPAGTDVFPGDDAPIVWVDRAAVEAAGPAERRLYDDFGIRDGDRVGCPSSFNLLTPGWHLNRPRRGEAANVAATPDFRMLACRDIAEGEELTVDYASFSGPAASCPAPQARRAP